MTVAALRERVQPPPSGWGVPDWTGNGGYPHPKTTPWSWWGWEFLRRNSDYRTEWLRSVYPFLMPLPLPDRVGALPPTFDYRAREKFVAAGCAVKLDYFGEFGLSFPSDPRSDWPLGLETGLPYIEPHELTQPNQIYLKPFNCPVMFDVRRPIEPQIMRARQLLLRVQAEFCAQHGTKIPPMPRPRGEELRLKLRALDAYDANAPTQERLENLRRRRSDDARWLDNLTRGAEDIARHKYSDLIEWDRPTK